MTVFYLIRHKPTGTFMPARVRATSYDFDRPARTHEPRLFNTERAAKNCATCWAQGLWTLETYTESDGWGHPSYTAQAPPAPNVAVAGRRREDLEVVRAELMVAG